MRRAICVQGRGESVNGFERLSRFLMRKLREGIAIARNARLELAVLLFYDGRHREALALVEGDAAPDLTAFTQKLRLQTAL